MKSLERSFLERQAVPLEFAGTLRLLGEYRGKQELYTRQTPQVLNALKQVAMIQSAESSNRIEGVIVEEKRLKPLLEKEATPRNRSEAEVFEALRKEGKLEVLGTGRGAKWRKRDNIQ